ncbi:MAG: DUF1997 domain-containing protein [Microcoleaceae cyanobacterium]
MQQDSIQLQSITMSQDLLNDSLNFQPSQQTDNAVTEQVESTWFQAKFEDCMVLYADVDQVAEYFANHRGWFCRCAEPMKTQPIGENAYDILIGRFGAFGYQVEARVGLELAPPNEQGIYKINTIPIPGYVPPGYVVNYEANMSLVELPVEEFSEQHKLKPTQIPPAITGAKWTLELGVGVQFPQFIRSMSQSLIQTTGDRLLRNIVKQVSRRLTYKTQLDFHTTYNIPFPKTKKHHLPWK